MRNMDLRFPPPPADIRGLMRRLKNG